MRCSVVFHVLNQSIESEGEIWVEWKLQCWLSYYMNKTERLKYIFCYRKKNIKLIPLLDFLHPSCFPKLSPTYHGVHHDIIAIRPCRRPCSIDTHLLLIDLEPHEIQNRTTQTDDVIHLAPNAVEKAPGFGEDWGTLKMGITNELIHSYILLLYKLLQF